MFSVLSFVQKELEMSEVLDNQSAKKQGKPADWINAILENPSEKKNRSLLEIDPKRCKPWKYHNRDKLWLTRSRCLDLIRSIEKNSQIEPILVRALKDDPDYDFEIICGVRRWFSCMQIPNQKVLGYVTEANDKQCMIIMHSENADSQDISDFERAVSFAEQMKSGAFKNQSDMAKAMGLSQSTICKMIKAADIFQHDWLRNLFDSKLEVPMRHAYALSSLLRKPAYHALIKKEAALILQEKIQGQAAALSGVATLRRLIKHVKGDLMQQEVSILLEKDQKPIVSARTDKSRGLHLSLDPQAKLLNHTQIQDLCRKAIDAYLSR
jgi:ParB family transcriptional regulator, chromosome partitioning protein